MRHLAILVLAAVPGGAAAQPSCGGQTQIAANFCARERWEIADRELNRLWGVVKPAADARGAGAALLEAQRAWLTARDAACEPALEGGGSADAMFYWDCMREATVQRNAELDALR